MEFVGRGRGNSFGAVRLDRRLIVGPWSVAPSVLRELARKAVPRVPTYVVLYTFTEQGLKSAKDTVRRADANRKANEVMGFKVRELLWTQGAYDLIAVVEAPDERSMMSGLLNVAGAGNVRSQTMRAFTADEMGALIAEIPWPHSTKRLRPI